LWDDYDESNWLPPDGLDIEVDVNLGSDPRLVSAVARSFNSYDGGLLAVPVTVTINSINNGTCISMPARILLISGSKLVAAGPIRQVLGDTLQFLCLWNSNAIHPVPERIPTAGLFRFGAFLAWLCHVNLANGCVILIIEIYLFANVRTIHTETFCLGGCVSLSALRCT
jgi:hypothetical protein